MARQHRLTRSGYWLAALCLWPPALLAEVVTRLELVTPRPVGYVIGDTIQHEIRLELSEPYVLDEDSLPEKGRLDRWLELRPPVLERDEGWNSTAYRILLTYQIFNVADRPTKVVIAGHEIAVTGLGQSLPVLVPEWPFTVAPIAPQRELPPAAPLDLRPERAPAPLGVNARVQRVMWTAAGLLGVLLGVVYLRWGVPLVTRRKRPFAEAFSNLKRLRNRRDSDTLHREALRSVHRAFNRTAGTAVFAEDLGGFFLGHPEFGSLRAPIEDFFAHSRQVFFGSDAAPEPGSLADLTRLCGRCRELERSRE